MIRSRRRDISTAVWDLLVVSFQTALIMVGTALAANILRSLYAWLVIFRGAV